MASTPQNPMIDNTPPASNLRSRPKRTPKYSKYASSVSSPTTSIMSPNPSAAATTVTTITAPPTTSQSHKKKPIKIEEKNIPEKLTAIIPESQLYTALLDFEKKLDYALVRRHLDVQEAVSVRAQRTKKIIRINIFNTYSNQSGVYMTDNKTLLTVADPPSWTLKIEGKLQDEQWNPRTQKPKRKFTSFIKKAFIQLGDDPHNTIEWERSQSNADTDGWEIKRAGDKEIEVRILLWIEQSPSKVKLSHDLASLLNIQNETRPRILMSLWQYIKANRLLDNDRKTINNDANLKRIFGCDTMQFSGIPQLLREHLGPMDPVEIVYTIKLMGEPHENSASYELQVDADDATAPQPPSHHKREIATCEDNIMQLIREIHERKRKRDFMMDFAKDPTKFMKKVIDEQIRDYKLSHSEPGRDTEEERHTQFYYQPYIEEAVQNYLTKRKTATQQTQIDVQLPQPPPTPTTQTPQQPQTPQTPSVTSPPINQPTTPVTHMM